MKRIIFGVMLILILIGVLTLISSIRPVESDSEVLFFDDFDDGVADGWTVILGNFQVIDGEYYTENDLGEKSITTVDGLVFVDCIVQTNVWLQATEGGFQAAIVLRYIDYEHHYTFSINAEGDCVSFEKYTPADPHYGELLAVNRSLSISMNTNYLLKVTMQGNTFVCFLDNEKVLSVTDDDYTSGQVGLRGQKADAYFDNFTVMSVPKTITVPDDYPTIQEAINAASDGDTIFVRNGTYYEHIVVNKAVSLIGENRSITIIDGNNTGNVVTIVADNVTINGFTIQHSGDFPNNLIMLDAVSSCTIFSNNIRNSFGRGIFLDSSIDNYVYNNLITNVSWNAFSDGCICLYNSLRNIILQNNVTKIGHLNVDIAYGSNGNWIINNTLSFGIGYGIKLYFSNFNHVINNTILNNFDGMLIEGSTQNDIVYNKILDTRFAINLVLESHNNQLVGNSLENNDWGVYLQSSDNNIFHNNIANNTVQAYSTSPNVWDNGYPSGGNYWSDYTGEDSYEGSYQNETGSDGIGDTPYVIDEDNIDHYPLMNPYTVTPPVPSVINATVDINPKALNLRSRGRWITAYIELPEGYDVADINVSSIMLNGTIPVDLEAPTEIGDYDNDSIPDLMVNFNRTALIEYILGQSITFGNVTLTVTGQLRDGIPFEGNTIIAVSDLAGDVNCDGVVDIYDVVEACLSYGSKEGEPNWNPNTNVAPPYDRIDIYDMVTIAYHHGETYP